MKILFVSRTPYSGGHIRMAGIFARRGHETRVLTPAIWEPELRFLGPKLRRIGVCWWIGDREIVDESLRWAEVIHFTYSSSLRELGREDLVGKIPCVWHLATRWKHGFHVKHFPHGDHRHYRFALSCEGWERYDLGPYTWTILPVLFPVDDEGWMPIPMAERVRCASISPRLVEDRFRGRPIPAPRAVPKLEAAMKSYGQPFRVISGQGWRRCMREKARSWIGVDDVVNPLVHLSGFEYLSLGVPCVNRRDEFIEMALGDLTGGPWPFVDPGETAEDTAGVVREALGIATEEWEGRSRAARAWMETRYSADLMAHHYERLYASSG